MATIKSYTDLEQSKKLAEILPLESADMWWAERYEGRVIENGQYIVAEEPYYYLSLAKPSNINYSQDSIKDIPAWSLAALLDQLEGRNSLELAIKYDDGQYFLVYDSMWETKYYNNLIDACYEMILKLHELKML